MPSVFCVPQRIYVVKNRLHRPEASPERRGEPPNGGGGVCRTHGRGFRTLRRAGMLPLRAAGAQEGRQPAVFHPLVNHPFSRKGLGADGRLRKRGKRVRQRIFSAAWYNTVSYFGCRTATQAVKLTQARHDSAAQRFYLCRLSKFCGCSQFAPENGLRGTAIPQGTFSCPSGNSPCAALCVE